VYDEAKRFGEALTMAYRTTHSVDTGIVRIFNTYGPRMRPRDGRAIPTFIRQAISNEPLTVAGDGSQTRSICYVDDLVDGILRMADSDLAGPINLGNPREISVLDLALRVKDLAKSSSEIRFVELPIDDPKVRCPDISRAIDQLSWKPEISLDEGLSRSIEWFSKQAD
jgi:dTDP-glucose 4,6-dehydratase